MALKDKLGVMPDSLHLLQVVYIARSDVYSAASYWQHAVKGTNEGRNFAIGIQK